MKPDLKETEALLDNLEKQFPEASDCINDARVTNGIPSRKVPKEEIHDMLARDPEDRRNHPTNDQHGKDAVRLR